MTETTGNQGPPDERLERLEARIARMEAHLGLVPEAPAQPEASAAAAPGGGEDLELQIGREWFARVGIAALGVGVAFTLSLPMPALPPAAPAVAGYALAASMAALAGVLARRSPHLLGPVRCTALLLAAFSGIRLCYFGALHPLDAGSPTGEAVLTLNAALLVALGARRGDPWLLGMALACGYATALAVGQPGWGMAVIALLSAAAAIAAVRRANPAFVLAAMPLAYGAYAAWALNNPLQGRPMQALAGPDWAPATPIVCLAVFAIGLRGSTRGNRDHVFANTGVFLNVLACYGVFLPSTLASFAPWFVVDQLAAAAAMIALAFAHEQGGDRVGSFMSAMTGFFALSFAIIRATASPDVFVWLSVQSVLVVATAIWLRSRFIVVANFAIYLSILGCYVAVAGPERGISIGFGLVALATARLLAWKQERLELRTELMRNAYLFLAFLIFPYSLYHLVPGTWVALAWVGAALLYYLISALLHNPKYRWMAHGTLVLTLLYLAFSGIGRLDPFVRNVSFLTLGAVLLVVSLVFSRIRKRD